jgi:glycerate-2-kinase
MPLETDSSQGLRDDALAIWQAGVDAVRADRLVADAVRVDGTALVVCGQRVELNGGRLAVVGAGKAGAGMAAGMERAIGDTLPGDRRIGWVNVPADCIRPTGWIHLHAARPAGVNEPTEAGVAGTREILRLVGSLTPRDVCVVLISGGGSALLTAPAAGISLADKVQVTRSLVQAGASIDELNAVRRRLSDVKGGGLLRACRAGTVIVLIISDVIGDPLETIASGPTIPSPTTAADALAILQRLIPDQSANPDSVWRVLSNSPATSSPLPLGEGSRVRGSATQPPPSPCALPSRNGPRPVSHHILANNRTALDAAAARASSLGYEVIAVRPDERGEARDVGRALAEECIALRDSLASSGRRLCLITGGEPVVHFEPSDRPRKGGRNQEVVLAAVDLLWDDGMFGVAILSGGTDGEDGPTDAAGAVADEELISHAHRLNLTPAPFLADHNSYPFFDQTGGLIRSGPTHTNVIDVRVALVARG